MSTPWTTPVLAPTTDRVAVAVVAKAPVAGRVKTRMQPPLTGVEAAELATAMLADVTDVALRTGADVWWSYAGDRAVLEPLRPDGVRLLAQVGDGLGRRLAHAHHTLHARGYGGVVLVGADCPTVDGADLGTALRLLAIHDVVLGPAADGGYTLLATRRCAPELYATVPMSTDHTAADTLAVARRLGLDTVVTPTRRDIDTVDDLRRVLAAGSLDHAPRTRTLAERLLPVTPRDPAAATSRTTPPPPARPPATPP